MSKKLLKCIKEELLKYFYNFIFVINFLKNYYFNKIKIINKNIQLIIIKGETIVNCYRFIKVLGEGSYGKVKLAIKKKLDSQDY